MKRETDHVKMTYLIPAVENICVVCWQLLRKKIDVHLELKVRLYETERNLVEYSGN